MTRLDFPSADIRRRRRRRRREREREREKCSNSAIFEFAIQVNPRLTETLFVTQLTKGRGVQNEPPYDAYFGTNG